MDLKENIVRGYKLNLSVRYGVFTSVKTSIVILWDVTPYCLVDEYLRFWGMCCLHFQDIWPWRWRQYVPPIHAHPPTRLHSLISLNSRWSCKKCTECCRISDRLSASQEGFCFLMVIRSRRKARPSLDQAAVDNCRVVHYRRFVPTISPIVGRNQL
jgi:hypothetical protein